MVEILAGPARRAWKVLLHVVTISVVAGSPAGVALADDENDAVRPNLYVLAIGVSTYRNRDFELMYPAKDAADFAAVLRSQEGRLYGRVQTRVLVDAEATRDNILDGLEWLQRRNTTRDVAVLFLAGHGIVDPATGRYNFMPHDADAEAIRRTHVPDSEILSTLRGIDGKVLVFLDTCHSGRVYSDRFLRSAPMVANVARDLLAANGGAIIFTASMGTQASQESREWGNGVFTKALIEGLSGHADIERTGRVTVAMLNLYVSERVKALTGGRQMPSTATPGNMPDIPLAVVSGSVRGPAPAGARTSVEPAPISPQRRCAGAAGAESSLLGGECKTVCTGGKESNIDTAGHCCWPGQAWSKQLDRCVGVPRCPAGMSADGDETCKPGCPTGKIVSEETLGRCCWPGQVFSTMRGECVGVPRCSDGDVVDGEDCVAAKRVKDSGRPTPSESARVPVRFTTDDNNVVYRFTVQDHERSQPCTTPCRLRILPGTLWLTVSSPATSIRMLILPDDTKEVRMRHRDRRALAAGAGVCAGIGLIGLVLGGVAIDYGRGDLGAFGIVSTMGAAVTGIVLGHEASKDATIIRGPADPMGGVPVARVHGLTVAFPW